MIVRYIKKTNTRINWELFSRIEIFIKSILMSIPILKTFFDSFDSQFRFQLIIPSLLIIPISFFFFSKNVKLETLAVRDWN